MKISQELKKTLVDELRLVAKKVADEIDVRKKIYFFSAAHAMIYRIFNINFDPELVCTYSSCTEFNARYSSEFAHYD